LKLLKNCFLFNPEKMGKKDILFSSNQIISIEDEIDITGVSNIQIHDMKNRFVVPGFIDNHVHITGGGGEGGFSTRIDPITADDIYKSGVTTLIGLLGTDGTTRTIEDLFAKAKSLNEKNITAYILTGSYRVPVKTLTGSIIRDIVFIDNIIGTGEIAISDHRSSYPSRDEIIKIITDSARGGLLADKAGVVNFHVGKDKKGIEDLIYLVKNYDISPKNILPTHMNRSKYLLREGIKYIKEGGFIDLTASSSSKDYRSKAEDFNFLIESGADIGKITFSSDGQGSLPRFNPEGKFLKMGVGKLNSLHETFKSLIIDFNFKLEEALLPITRTPSKIYKLDKKGEIKTGGDSDFVVLNRDTYDIDFVISGGKYVFKNKKNL